MNQRQYTINREAFLRDRKILLKDHYEKTVAYVNGEFFRSRENVTVLIEDVHKNIEPGAEIYIGYVTESSFETPKEIVDSPSTEVMNK